MDHDRPRAARRPIAVSARIAATPAAARVNPQVARPHRRFAATLVSPMSSGHGSIGTESRCSLWLAWRLVAIRPLPPHVLSELGRRGGCLSVLDKALSCLAFAPCIQCAALLTPGSLAQLVEHRAFNPLVLGSSPRRPTIARCIGVSTFLTQAVCGMVTELFRPGVRHGSAIEIRLHHPADLVRLACQRRHAAHCGWAPRPQRHL